MPAILQEDTTFIERAIMKTRLTFISVDIETTGPTPGHYSMYELGACVIGSNSTFERSLSLLAGTRFSLPALRAVSASTKGLLSRTETVPAKTAMSDFAKWVRNAAEGTRPIFVANNAAFDWMFVAWYFEEFSVTNPFGHSALDMKAYYMGMNKVPWEKATLREMARYAGIKFVGLPHRALFDSQIQGDVFTQLVKTNFNRNNK